MEGGGRSKNLHLLCLALNNLLRDLKEALCDQRQMSTDLRLYFPCASAVEGGSSFVGGCSEGRCYLMRRRNKRKRREKEKKAPSRTLGVTPTFLAGDVFLLLSACWSNGGGFNHQTELFNKVRYCIFIFREAPIYKLANLFGHCPNSC